MINHLGYLPDQIRPLKDCVLVRPDPVVRETQSAGGILLPGQKPRPIDGHWATVLAVPEELESYRRSCKTCERPYDQYDDSIAVGDRVLMDNQHSGDAVMVDGEECRLVRVAELLAIVEA